MDYGFRRVKSEDTCVWNEFILSNLIIYILGTDNTYVWFEFYLLDIAETKWKSLFFFSIDTDGKRYFPFMIIR